MDNSPGLDQRFDFVKLKRQQYSTPASNQRSNNNNTQQPFQKNFMKTFTTDYSEDQIRELRKKQDIFIKSDHKNVPAPFSAWSDYPFPSYITEQLERMNFDKPSPIQSQGQQFIILEAFPIILQGNDLIGVAQTGSGKTLAFLLPGLIHLKAQPRAYKGDGPIMLVLAPTRELAMQIHSLVDKFKLETACLYGGVDKRSQEFRLIKGVDVIIATPGRMNDFLEQGRTNLDRTTYVVIDEADRMLDMGFEPQVRKIVERTRVDRQTIFFSATWPREVQDLARDFCREDPVHIQIGLAENSINKDIKQSILVLNNHEEKLDELFFILDGLNKDSKVLIFAQTKRECEDLSYKLRDEDYYALSLHGDKTQQERDYVMNELRMSRVKIVVATDVAQRGLDVRDITHVVNYDFPKQIEDYIHRIGRTGRAGDQGQSISFILHGEEDPRLINALITVMKRAEQEISDDLLDYGFGRKPKSNKVPTKKHTYKNDKQSSANNYEKNNNRNFQDKGTNQFDRRPPTEHTFERRKNDEPKTADRLPPRGFNSFDERPVEIKKALSNIVTKQSSQQDDSREPPKPFTGFFNSKSK